jgi:hypothetical protein
MAQTRAGSRNQDMDTTAAQGSSSGYAIAGQLGEEAYNQYPFKLKSFNFYRTAISIRIYVRTVKILGNFNLYQ